MSTIYNPLSSDSFLQEFSNVGTSGAAVAGRNSIPGESAPSSLGVSSGSFGSAIGDALGKGGIPGMGEISSAASTLFGVATGTPALSISRIVAIVLGLLLIAGGIIMFRPEIGENITSAAKDAAFA